jgi:hypothetical protein
VKAIKTPLRNYRLDLEFRRVVRHVPHCQRPGLHTWLRRCRRRQARTVHESHPATWSSHRLLSRAMQGPFRTISGCGEECGEALHKYVLGPFAAASPWF